MHHWAVGGDIYIGWPDHGAEERRYTIVEMDLSGKVFRGRVTNGQRQGGFMVIFDCPNVILEQLAEQASNVVGFRVIVSNLRTSIDGVVVRSFDYEWYPTPEFAERPHALATALATLYEDIAPGQTDK
ncbi:hypothetical protein GBAR_LOCUS18266 [Geodia barretti]|uniref:Uncharacterized protein n=1 Tax=Geodia barretti TaxID=519541 RepID=A0AA35SM15_GEOBA|nr:hypothetical protein GBAR_LOCUS18266 [Geodia barretti]